MFLSLANSSDFTRTTYTDPHGKTRDWESAERLTRPAGVAFDGVGILAIVTRQGARTMLLQKQFRPAIGQICIEFPAGLVDAGETATECALRELREETGYTGKVVGDDAGCLMFNDPGMCNTNLYMVHVSIDADLEENKSPKQKLEENEFIECFEVPVDELWETCKRLDREGFAVDARVGTLAEGMKVARKLELIGKL
jgi:ADP-ribose pyrophosphatase